MRSSGRASRNVKKGACLVLVWKCFDACVGSRGEPRRSVLSRSTGHGGDESLSPDRFRVDRVVDRDVLDVDPDLDEANTHLARSSRRYRPR